MEQPKEGSAPETQPAETPPNELDELFGEEANFFEDPEPDKEPDVAAKDNAEEQAPDVITEENLESDNLDNQADDAIPEKFQGKTADEVITSYLELEKAHGKFAGKEPDLALIDELVKAATDNPEAKKALKFLLDKEYESGSFNEQPGDSDEDEFLTEEEKQIQTLMKDVAKLKEDNAKYRGALEHSKGQAQQSENDEKLKAMSTYYSKLSGIEITPDEVRTHFEKQGGASFFKTPESVFVHLAMLKKDELSGVKNEAERKKRGKAPRVSQPGKKVEMDTAYGNWDGMGSSLRKVISV